MTLQEFKNIFENIAVKVVAHQKGEGISHFLMADEDTAIKAMGQLLDTSDYCMEVSYPIDDVRAEGTEHYNKPNFTVLVYKAVNSEDLAAQEVTLQTAKEKVLEVASWLYCSQKANNGFGVIPNSSTAFDDTNFKIMPFIDKTNGLCGREVTFTFKEIIKLYDQTKINQINDLYQ